MVDIRIIFKDWHSANFVAFSLAEAFTIVQEYDSDSIISIHIYPNKNDQYE